MGLKAHAGEGSEAPFLPTANISMGLGTWMRLAWYEQAAKGESETLLTELLTEPPLVQESRSSHRTTQPPPELQPPRAGGFTGHTGRPRWEVVGGDHKSSWETSDSAALPHLQGACLPRKTLRQILTLQYQMSESITKLVPMNVFCAEYIGC